MRNEKGMTLMEVIIALFFLSLMLLGIANTRYAAIKGNGLGIRRMVAYALAENKLKEIKSLGYSGAAVGNFSDGIIDENGISSATGLYTRDWTVTAESDGTKAVVVTVSWNYTGLSGAKSVSTKLAP